MLWVAWQHGVLEAWCRIWPRGRSKRVRMGLLRRSRAGRGASPPSQVRPPGVDRGGVAPRGLGAEVRPTGGTGACFLGRGPLGGVGLLLLWLLPLRWEGTRGPRGARVPRRGRGYRLYAKEPLSQKKKLKTGISKASWPPRTLFLKNQPPCEFGHAPPVPRQNCAA